MIVSSFLICIPFNSSKKRFFFLALFWQGLQEQCRTELVIADILVLFLTLRENLSIFDHEAWCLLSFFPFDWFIYCVSLFSSPNSRPWMTLLIAANASRAWSCLSPHSVWHEKREGLFWLSDKRGFELSVERMVS